MTTVVVRRRTCVPVPGQVRRMGRVRRTRDVTVRGECARGRSAGDVPAVEFTAAEDAWAPRAAGTFTNDLARRYAGGPGTEGREGVLRRSRGGDNRRSARTGPVEVSVETTVGRA
jgi:hypothetical protein